MTDDEISDLIEMLALEMHSGPRLDLMQVQTVIKALQVYLLIRTTEDRLK